MSKTDSLTRERVGQREGGRGGETERERERERERESADPLSQPVLCCCDQGIDHSHANVGLHLFLQDASQLVQLGLAEASHAAPQFEPQLRHFQAAARFFNPKTP
jgi:hypothetical protein